MSNLFYKLAAPVLPGPAAPRAQDTVLPNVAGVKPGGASMATPNRPLPGVTKMQPVTAAPAVSKGGAMGMGLNGLAKSPAAAMSFNGVKRPGAEGMGTAAKTASYVSWRLTKMADLMQNLPGPQLPSLQPNLHPQQQAIQNPQKQIDTMAPADMGMPSGLPAPVPPQAPQQPQQLQRPDPAGGLMQQQPQLPQVQPPQMPQQPQQPQQAQQPQFNGLGELLTGAMNLFGGKQPPQQQQQQQQQAQPSITESPEANAARSALMDVPEANDEQLLGNARQQSASLGTQPQAQPDSDIPNMPGTSTPDLGQRYPALSDTPNMPGTNTPDAPKPAAGLPDPVPPTMPQSSGLPDPVPPTMPPQAQSSGLPDPVPPTAPPTQPEQPAQRPSWSGGLMQLQSNTLPQAGAKPAAPAKPTVSQAQQLWRQRFDKDQAAFNAETQKRDADAAYVRDAHRRTGSAAPNDYQMLDPKKQELVDRGADLKQVVKQDNADWSWNQPGGRRLAFQAPYGSAEYGQANARAHGEWAQHRAQQAEQAKQKALAYDKDFDARAAAWKQNYAKRKANSNQQLAAQPVSDGPALM